MLTSHFISNGDIQTACFEAGDGDPFVLVHGFTGSKLDFQDQLPWFADLRRTIAYDQRGHGESSNQGPYEESQFVADLIGLLDRLDFPECDLLGHSFGGMVAMRAALEHPQRVRSLILMDTAPGPMTLFPDAVREQLNQKVQEDGCDSLLTMMRGAEPDEAAQRGVDYLGEQEHWRRISVKLAQMDPDAFCQLGALFSSREDLTDALAALACPVTVIVGADDQPFLEPSRVMASRIPGAALEVIEGAGHNPQYENPHAWRSCLRAHLARTGQPAGTAQF